MEILDSEFLGETFNNLQANLTLAILANLFQNSADAKTDVLVSILCDKDGPSLTIDISDNAGGISGGVKPLLFSPVNSTKKRGSGIGLALSKQLAESMGAIYPWLIRIQKVLVSACPWFWHDRFNRNLLPNYRFINRIIYAKHEFSVNAIFDAPYYYFYRLFCVCLFGHRQFRPPWSGRALPTE